MNSSEQQLLDLVKELFPNFTITLQDLRTPTEEFATSFYTFWLSEFEVNIANIPHTQFSQQTANVSAYPDAYSSTIPKINLLLAIRTLNVVPDFGMLDITSPTPKRIQTVIRAFCDFYQWCDMRVCGMFAMKAQKKVKERKQHLAALVRERVSLQEELNNVFKAIGTLQNSKKELEENMMRYKQEASELRVEVEMIKTQTDEADARIKEKDAILNKLLKEDSQISGKINDFSNDIVNSPTTVLTDLETLRAKDEEMKNLSEQKRDVLEEKMKAQKNLEEILTLMEEKSSQLDEVLKLVEHHRKLLHVVTDIEKTTVGCQEELEELKSTLVSIMKKKSVCEEELQALDLKWRTMKEQLTKDFETAKSEINNQKGAKSKMIDCMKEDASLEKEITSVMDKMTAHIRAFEEEFNRILNQETAYFEKLQNDGLAQMQRLQLKESNITQKKKSKK